MSAQWVLAKWHADPLRIPIVTGLRCSRFLLVYRLTSSLRVRRPSALLHPDGAAIEMLLGNDLESPLRLSACARPYRRVRVTPTGHDSEVTSVHVPAGQGGVQDVN